MIPSIPLYLLFIPYIIFLIIFGIFLFFHLHNLKIYAVKSTSAAILRTFFLLGTVFILGTSAVVLSGYDWTATVPINDLFSTLFSRSLSNPF